MMRYVVVTDASTVSGRGGTSKGVMVVEARHPREAAELARDMMPVEDASTCRRVWVGTFPRDGSFIDLPPDSETSNLVGTGDNRCPCPEGGPVGSCQHAR